MYETKTKIKQKTYHLGFSVEWVKLIYYVIDWLIKVESWFYNFIKLFIRLGHTILSRFPY